MRKDILFGGVGLLVGVILTVVVQNLDLQDKQKSYQEGANEMHQKMNSASMNDAMHMMNSGLSNKTGTEFDRAFISEMIIHHQGAIDMAKQALTNSSRQEIKNLAQDIISAQNKEIEMMKQWQKEWFK